MKYYFLAGETSGDKHAASIIEALYKIDAQAEFRFFGGEEMEKITNTKAVIHTRELAIMGFVEVLKNIFKIRRFFSIAQADILSFKPDVVVFVDYPGFNLRLAQRLHGKVPRLVYYISPTVWAWHKSRVHIIKKCIDIMICILPFEPKFYKTFGVPAVYYGNPIVDKVLEYKKNNVNGKKFNSKPTLAILPGSREQEIKKILPVMVRTTSSFNDRYDIIIPIAPSIDIKLYKKIITDNNGAHIMLKENSYYDVLNNASLAMVTSGTATLEAAVFEVPQVVCYITSPVTYFIAKNLVKIKFISLVNIICEKEVVKELIQGNCNEKNLREELIKLESENKSDYAILKEKLGSESSAEKIAEAIYLKSVSKKE